MTQTIWTSEKRQAFQFRTRRDALNASRSLGFPATSPARVDIMGFMIWVISDDHCRFLTKFGFDSLKSERDSARNAIRARAFHIQE